MVIWECPSGTEVQAFPATLLNDTPAVLKNLTQLPKRSLLFFFFSYRKKIVQREDVAITKTKIGNIFISPKY